MTKFIFAAIFLVSPFAHADWVSDMKAQLAQAAKDRDSKQSAPAAAGARKDIAPPEDDSSDSSYHPQSVRPGSSYERSGRMVRMDRNDPDAIDRLPKKTCPDKPIDNMDVLSRLGKFLDRDEPDYRAEAVDAIEKRLNNSVGACVTGLPKGFEHSTNFYETYLQPSVKASYRDNHVGDSYNFVKVGADGGSHELNMKNFIAIDAVARTVYGEMNTCGRVYMKATTAVILNRANCGSQFGGSKGSAGGKFAEVVLEPHAFSVWNSVDWDTDPTSRKAQAAIMRRISCPPHSDPNWKTAVSIAISAVLKQRQFGDEIEGFPPDLVSYTSAMDRNPRCYKGEQASISGVNLANSRCMQFWTNKCSRKTCNSRGFVE